MFEAVVSQEGKVLTISLRGECDLQTFAGLRELISASRANEMLEREDRPPRPDVHGLHRPSHSDEANDVRVVGATLSIVPGPRAVMRVFEIVGTARGASVRGTGSATL